MADDSYKKYTQAARRGIKGEAHFESLIVDHAIPHRIARQNDLGIDFLCEWVCGDRPTGILFSAQVKSTTDDAVKVEFIGKSELNGLSNCTLHGANRIDDATLNYWKGLGFPAYLFIVIEHRLEGTNHAECYYKRYTPRLDGRPSKDDNDATTTFYQVSEGARFLAFADALSCSGGFARDLIVDYARMAYSRGHIVPLTPEELGFWPFRNKQAAGYFRGPAIWHRKKIEATWKWTKAILEQVPANDES